MKQRQPGSTDVSVATDGIPNDARGDRFGEARRQAKVRRG